MKVGTIDGDAYVRILDLIEWLTEVREQVPEQERLDALVSAMRLLKSKTHGALR